MKKYLLDTNICVYFLNGKFSLREKFDEIGIINCFISEITIAELKYGIEKSTRKTENKKIIESFQTKFDVLPIFPTLDMISMQRKKPV